MDADLYRQRLAALREENEFLRQAAHAFGELAERLAHELRELRAQGDRVDHRDRRSTWTGTAKTHPGRQTAPRR